MKYKAVVPLRRLGGRPPRLNKRSIRRAAAAPVLDEPVGTGVARYMQLSTLFRRRIEGGQWQVGMQIPTVEELAEECVVARATIRRALDILEADGLIERYRAKGTFVCQRPAVDLWCAVGTDWSGLLRPSYDARIEVLLDRASGKFEAQTAGLGVPAAAYRHVRRRHWRDDRPFLIADLRIDERLRTRIGKKELQTKTALRLVSEVPGTRIVDARQTLTVGAADLESAQALNIPLGAPVAIVRRYAIDQKGVVVLIAVGTYRGDVVRFDVKLK